MYIYVYIYTYSPSIMERPLVKTNLILNVSRHTQRLQHELFVLSSNSSQTSWEPSSWKTKKTKQTRHVTRTEHHTLSPTLDTTRNTHALIAEKTLGIGQLKRMLWSSINHGGPFSRPKIYMGCAPLSCFAYVYEWVIVWVSGVQHPGIKSKCCCNFLHHQQQQLTMLRKRC